MAREIHICKVEQVNDDGYTIHLAASDSPEAADKILQDRGISLFSEHSSYERQHFDPSELMTNVLPLAAIQSFQGLQMISIKPPFEYYQTFRVGSHMRATQ